MRAFTKIFVRERASEQELRERGEKEAFLGCAVDEYHSYEYRRGKFSNVGQSRLVSIFEFKI